jgi:hypothetical protein
VLHQFLSAETIQIPEEGILLNFLGVLFLRHSCTLLESESYVNFADSHILRPLPEKPVPRKAALGPHGADFHFPLISFLRTWPHGALSGASANAMVRYILHS